MTPPDLSVIVTVVEGGAALTRCLEALSDQAEPPSMEVIVPFDETIPEVGDLAGRFPACRFLPLETLAGSAAPANEYDRHVLYDRRRSGGLRSARGRLLAMLEDRGWPRSDWARRMVELHETSPCPAIGGAVESGAEGALRWAVYFCDFGRYQPPLPAADPQFLTDINICYKRTALDSLRDLWKERYQEAEVNWRLRRQGQGLLLSDEPVVVQQRGPMALWPALMERIHWGRTFGQVRGRAAPRGTCLLWATATPILPYLLFLRHLRRQIGKRRNLREFALAAPATLLLLHFWALGEFQGYAETAMAPRHPVAPS